MELNPATPYITLPASFTVYDTLKRGKKDRLEQEAAKNEKEQIAEGQEKPEKVEKKPANNSGAANNNNNNKKNLDQSFESKATDNVGLASELYNKLPISFNFKHPVKDYGSLIILKNSLKTDVRVYRLTVTVAPKVVKATLEMKVPGGDEVRQEIPIVNNTEKDWLIKANLTPDISKNGQYFYGKR